VHLWIAGLALGSLAALSVSCTKHVSRIRTLSLADRNLTSYVFETSIDKAHESAMAALHTLGAPEATFGTREANASADDVEFADYFAVEDSHDAVIGRDVLSAPENRDDIYVHTWGEPLWPSPVYRGRFGGLPFIAAFLVHLSAQGTDRTLVTVRAIDPRVINGMKWGIGSCGPGYAWRYEPVAATTVEEYALLRYLGKSLGAPNMPNVIAPSAQK
jgi:hypothetical protein